MQERAADVFGLAGAPSSEPPVDVKTLRAKIGQLTLENDFLSSALTKSGLRDRVRITRPQPVSEADLTAVVDGASRKGLSHRVAS